MQSKKLVSILLVSMVVISMLSGCTKKQETTPTTANTSSEYKTNLKISIANWGMGGVNDPKEDKVRDIIYKKFNITIEPVNITWDDYKTKINTWAAAGTLPDVFVDDAITESNFSKWCTQGVVKALPTDLSAYPVLKKYLDTKDAQDYKYPTGSPDAKYFCIPRATYSNIDMWANNNAIMLRLDWMKKVGVTKIPTTMEEFTSLMQKFVTEDPDGNGKNDTIGLTCYNASFLSTLFINYEPALASPINNFTKASDGSWIPAFMTDNALTGVVALKKLYDDGCIDKDFATLKGDDGKNKFMSGVAGAYAHQGTPSTLNSVYTGMAKINPDVDWTNTVAILPPFKAQDGNYYRTIGSTPYSETYFNANCSYEKVSRMLSLMNWGLSEEGFNLVRYGIEGTDYTKTGDKISIIKQKDSAGKEIVNNVLKYPILKNGFASFFSWNQDFSYKNPAVPEQIRKTGNDMLNWQLKNCKPTPTNLTLNFVNYDSKDNATFKIQDELTKALLSKDAAAEWKTMVSDFRKNGYDKVIVDLNKKAKELGIDSYTEN